MGKRNSVIWRELDSIKAGGTAASQESKSSSSSKKIQMPDPVKLMNQAKSKVMKLIKKE